MSRNIIVGVTGASGAAYARKLIQALTESEVHVHLVVSPHGRRLFAEELGISPVTVPSILGRESEKMTLHAANDVGSIIASGSYNTDGMVICPCSANSLGAIASGLGENLLHRAAQVTLKEMRRLVLVYREMPMGQVDLKNALTLSQAGAVFCPASPGFYMMPQSIDDIIDFVVGKVLALRSRAPQLTPRCEPDRINLPAPTPRESSSVER